jgi:hypothetical protein
MASANNSGEMTAETRRTQRYGFGSLLCVRRVSAAYSRLRSWLPVIILGVSFVATFPASANTLNWNTSKGRVTADIKGSELLPVLEQVASATGWKVFVEADTIHNRVSASFTDANTGQALKLLLGDVNYALVPQSTGSSKLYVFRTSQGNATVAVTPSRPAGTNSTSKVIPNELIVRLKPGAKIEDIARLLGAKVVGKIDSMNAYRLQFDDAAAADTARKSLASNSDVASVDSNYTVDVPTTPNKVPSGSSIPGVPQLQMKPPSSDSGHVIVGLVDTGVQTLGNGLDDFLLKQISVAGQSQLDPSSPSHGTSMAETILRSLQAVTKGSTSVEILPVDVYGANSSSSTFDVANGIVTAVNNGAKIVNLSLGTDTDSSFLRSVIEDASSKNILLIAAAGNTPVTTAFYPAAYQGVLAVTAIDSDKQLASYANRGSFISLGTSGTSVVYYNGQAYYVAGTSASSAYISGAAAGYMDAKGGTSSQTQNFLLSNFGYSTTSGK